MTGSFLLVANLTASPEAVWNPIAIPAAQGAGAADEAAARQEFERVWDDADTVVPFSSGSVASTCTPGQANPEAISKMLSTWNYMRSLNGLSPVTQPGDYPASRPAQAAALTAAIGPVASSNPAAVEGAACVNDDVRLASKAGVIARLNGIVTPATEILRYITEASTTNSNDNLGHRLEMFSPHQSNTAIGAVSIGTSGPTGTSIQLFDSTYRGAGRPLTPPLWDNTLPNPASIAWPSPGYFPTKLLPTGANEEISRWSFSARCADLRNAKLSVTAQDGQAIPVQVIHRDEPGVEANLTPWNYAGYDTILFKVPLNVLNIPTFYQTSAYKVNVSDIKTAPGCPAVPKAASYTVELFNPTWPANPQGDFDGDGIQNYLDAKPRIPDLNTSRIGGKDRVETAAKIALQMPSPSPRVYLARSDILVDALTGGVLQDGPVLLVPPDGKPLPEIVKRALAFHNPAEIVALGGPGAVSDQRLYEIAAGKKATRLGGSNRVQTSFLIARAAARIPSVKIETLYLAQAYSPEKQGSPDALSGGSLSDGPIALVDASAPTIATMRQLAADLSVKRVVALGGEAAVPDSVLQRIAVKRAATRLGGGDRYETSREIAMETYRLHHSTKAYLARGDVFADAVAGGKLSDGPILLVAPRCQALPPESLQTLARISAFQITALGGTGAICEANLHQSLSWPDFVRDSVTEF